MTASPISIVIPVWNLWHMTRACLASLAEHTPAHLFDVWVVDNGSDDATREELEPFGQALFGARFHVVRFAENRGFAIACNAGARQAGGEYVFFLNNDTLALPDWLPPLLGAFVDGPAGCSVADVGAVGPLLLYEGGERVQHAGVAFSYGGVQHLYAQFPAAHPALTRTRRFQALTAASLLLPRTRFLDMGLFHEGYHNGFEDLELCWHLSRAGFGLYCLPETRMIHRESSTPGRMAEDRRNAALLASRCPESPRRDLYDFAEQDGFVVNLGEVLDTRVCLHPREAARVARVAAGADINTLWSLLLEYPVWQRGYAQLGEMLMRSARYAECVYIRTLECNLFPSCAAYAGLEQAAEASDVAEVAAQARYETARRTAHMKDREGLRGKAVMQSRLARRDGRSDIEALYLEWLRGFEG